MLGDAVQSDTGISDNLQIRTFVSRSLHQSQMLHRVNLALSPHYYQVFESC